VQGAIIFGEPWPLGTDARHRYPGRVVPLLAEGYANAVHPDSSCVHPDGLEQLLSAGAVRGLGEVICRQSAFQPGAAAGYDAAPANSVLASHPALIRTGFCDIQEGHEQHVVVEAAVLVERIDFHGGHAPQGRPERRALQPTRPTWPDGHGIL
jgi:hypothetical protein